MTSTEKNILESGRVVAQAELCGEGLRSGEITNASDEGESHQLSCIVSHQIIG